SIYDERPVILVHPERGVGLQRDRARAAAVRDGQAQRDQDCDDGVHRSSERRARGSDGPRSWAGPVPIQSIDLRDLHYGRLAQFAMQNVKLVWQSIFCCGVVHWNLQLPKVWSAVIRQP